MPTNPEHNYNCPPESVGIITIPNHDELEMMCYLYQPIKIPGNHRWDLNLEPRLEPFIPMITACERFEVTCMSNRLKISLTDAWEILDNDYYYYLTVKNLFVTPDNCANRPGWHTDGFGGEDINYTWCNTMPTLFSHSTFTNIDVHHSVSMHQFDEQAKPEDDYELPPCTLTRLDPFIVHRTPKNVKEGMRTFFKLSISKHPYNLKGNSRNPLLKQTLEWKFYGREGVRNEPIYQGKDYVPTT